MPQLFHSRLCKPRTPPQIEICFHSRNAEKTINQLLELIVKNDVGEIVVGLPKNMDGSEGARVDTVRAFAKILSEITDIPLDFLLTPMELVSCKK